ncbi:MAG: transglycosylase domain-containing protein [Litorimonas sp.]
MATFRADIDVEHNKTVSKRKNLILFFAILILGLVAAVYIFAQSYLLKDLPNLPDKTTMWELNLQPNMTLLDKDGAVIGHRGPYIGMPLKLSEMPNYVANAFLAIEDERFYEHEGTDNRAILRAFFQNAKSGGKGQGGSTLTQQLVKNMVLSPKKTYRRKFQEAVLARDMESVMSKPEILELYLNRINLGPRVFGVEAAAQRYFSKSARDMSLSEAALLAAIPQAPSRWNPTSNYNGALNRSHLVLGRMLANDLISSSEHAQALATPPVIAPDAVPLIEPDYIGHIFDIVDEQSKNLVDSKHKDLIIQTTIDVSLQKQAQATVKTILDKHAKRKKASEAALVSVDNSTGAIVALVGGRDYSASKFNRASQAKRQPGSSFKTFAYAAALEDGFTPGTVRIDQPTNIGGWEPENYTRRYRGPMTLREALKHSINTIAAQVTVEIGPETVILLARRFGIRSKLRPEYSLALGSSEVTLQEMTTGYSVFINEGILRPSYLISSIKNTSNTPLYTRRNKVGSRVYPVPYAQQMTQMLSDVVQTGTGHGAQLGNREAGGKTGTSQDYRDAWFVGFTAQFTTGVWMGNDDNSPMGGVTGGLLPADIWKNYNRAIHKGYKYRPLIPQSALQNSEELAPVLAFYADLTDALITERDIAAGITR